MLNVLRCLMLAVALALIASMGASPASAAAAASAVPGDQGARAANGGADKCPLRAADLDKLTPYRWQVAQYKADQVFIPNGSIRIDYCELIGKDDKGGIRTGVMVNIARGDHAAAFAKHWRAVCAGSLMPDARGKVQPIPAVPGGQQCVTAKGGSSAYWIESAGDTIQVEAENEDAAVARVFPQILVAAAQ